MRTTWKGLLTLALGACVALAAVPARAQTNGDPYGKLPKREFGTLQDVLDAIEKDIQAAKSDQYPAIEAKLVAVIESADATLAGKQFACQMLRLVASPKCVPAAAKLLGDEKLSHMARCVLVGLSDPSAAEALRKALATTQGNQQLGVINSLGDRRDEQSVDALAGLIGPAPAVNQAALRALGKIGTTKAADAIEKAKVPDGCKDAQAEATLTCAEALCDSDAARAQKMYQSVMDGAAAPSFKAGAFVALARLQKGQAVPLVLKTLQSPDALLRRAAGSAMLSLTGPEAGKAFGKELASLQGEAQISLLNALAARGEAAGLTETVNALACDKDAAVRQAAIAALSKLGDATTVKVLAGMVKEGDGIGQAATTTLIRLQAPGVAEALGAQVQAGEPAVRAAMIDVVAARKQVDALPAVRQAAGDSDPKVRQAALKALADLGSMDDLPKMVELLVAGKDNAEREQLARSILAAASRCEDRDKRCQPIIQGLANADEKAKALLLGCLAGLGGEQALKTMRANLAGEGEVKKAVVRALAEWPSPEPLADLLEAAKTDKDATVQILALRGYVRLAGLSKIGSGEKVKAFAQAMELAKRAEEKKLVLAGLAKVNDPAALKAVQPCLDEAELKNEAFAAYAEIAQSLAKSKPAVAKEALSLVAEKAPDAGMRNRAKQALGKIK